MHNLKVTEQICSVTQAADIQSVLGYFSKMDTESDNDAVLRAALFVNDFVLFRRKSLSPRKSRKAYSLTAFAACQSTD